MIPVNNGFVDEIMWIIIDTEFHGARFGNIRSVPVDFFESCSILFLTPHNPPTRPFAKGEQIQEKRRDLSLLIFFQALVNPTTNEQQQCTPTPICSSNGVRAACMRAYRVDDSIVFILVVLCRIYQILKERIKRGTPSWQTFFSSAGAKIRISERNAK